MSSALQTATYTVTWASFVTAIASCLLRCYCCRAVKRSWTINDSLSLIVGIFLVGALVVWQELLSLGCSGSEPSTCDNYDTSGKVLKWLFICSIVYDAVLHFVIRTAFFIFYLQLSGQIDYRLWIGMGFGMGGMLLIFNVLIIVFQCQPITASFHPAERLTAQCMHTGFAVFAPAVLNALLNVYSLVLPIPVIYSLRLPIRRKLNICCMFAIGGAAVLLGFVHFRSLRVIISGTNTSKAIGETMIISSLGMSLAVIALNLPSMRILWHHVSKSHDPDRASNASQRPCEARAGDIRKETSMYISHSPVYEIGSLSSTILPLASATSPMVQPSPALMDKTGRLRFPAVNEEFSSRPSMPPKFV